MPRAPMMDVTTRSPHHPCPANPKPRKLTCSRPPHFKVHELRHASAVSRKPKS